MDFDDNIMNTPEEIKAQLPIVFVLDKAGVEYTDSGNRITASRCPVHADEDQQTPSFSIYEGKWNCFACGNRGDVFDLMQKLDESLTFGGTVTLAREYLAEIDATGWAPLTASRKPTTLDPEDIKSAIRIAQNNKDNTVISRLISLKRHKDGTGTNRFSAQWLRDNFGVGVSKTKVVVPYRNVDGEYVAYKTRTPGQKMFAEEGTRYHNLYYNEWRTDNMHLPCLIVEGESDTWNAQYEVGNDYRVLGVATGVGTTPHSIDSLSMDVLIAFDGDDRGRAGLKKWSEALTAAGKNVLIVAMPEGGDVSSCGAKLKRMCQQARPLLKAPSGINVDPSGYTKSTKDGKTTVSNWTFRPTKFLSGEVGGAFEGVIMPGNMKAVITTEDLRTKMNITAWSHEHGRTWLGSDRDAAVVLGMLQAESVFLPIGRLTTVAGLNDDTFVYPGGVIGSEEWSYISPSSSSIEESFFIAPGNWEPEYIHTMRNIHKHSITDPILAWLAIAPLRTVMPRKEFPLLQITGDFGAGKTTSVEALVKGMSGTYLARSLATSTPYTVKEDTASSSSFPIIFEEKRQDGRQDTLEAFDRIARNAYNMLSSRSGGAKSTWSAIATSTPTAPIIISGEDTFSDGALIERMIMIQFTAQGGNKEAFDEVRNWESNGLPFIYLSWLQRELKAGLLDWLDVRPEGPENLAPRIRTNLGIIYAGWRLLQRFMEEAYDGLGEPDFSGVISTLDNARRQTPLENGIRWCLGEANAGGFVFIKQGKLYVKVENFVAFINDHTRGRRSDMSLPGGTASVINYLKGKYNAEMVVEVVGDLRREFLVMNPADILSGEK